MTGAKGAAPTVMSSIIPWELVFDGESETRNLLNPKSDRFLVSRILPTKLRQVTGSIVLGCSLVALLGGCSGSRDRLFRELQQHEARDHATWEGWDSREISERIIPAPDVIIDYLRKDNIYNGWEEIPEAARIDPAFHADIISAFVNLPEAVQKHFREYTVAVFLVRQLGGTAYGEVLREYEDIRKGFIVLDVEPLKRAANEWAAWKENSAFAGNGPYRLEAIIEKKEPADRIHAIQYILLHEIGHMVGFAERAYPNLLKGGDPEKWSFSKLSWRSSNGDYESRFDDDFEKRKSVRYYRFDDAELRSEDIPGVYQSLVRTDFVSLYAATSMYDDFAETYAMYVHVVVQDRPWTLRIMRGSEKVEEIDRPILERRCSAKKEFLDELFGRKGV